MNEKAFFLDRRVNGDMAFAVWSAQALPEGIKHCIDEDRHEVESDHEDTDDEDEDENQASSEHSTLQPLDAGEPMEQ